MGQPEVTVGIVLRLPELIPLPHRVCCQNAYRNRHARTGAINLTVQFITADSHGIIVFHFYFSFRSLTFRVRGRVEYIHTTSRPWYRLKRQCSATDLPAKLAKSEQSASAFVPRCPHDTVTDASSPKANQSQMSKTRRERMAEQLECFMLNKKSLRPIVRINIFSPGISCAGRNGALSGEEP